MFFSPAFWDPFANSEEIIDFNPDDFDKMGWDELKERLLQEIEKNKGLSETLDFANLQIVTLKKALAERPTVPNIENTSRDSYDRMLLGY